MTILRENQRKIAEKYFYVFKYGKAYSDREFIEEALKLMSEKVHSEEGYRQEIDNANKEKASDIKINKVPTLFDLIKERLAGGQQRKLEEILRSIRRETEDDEFSVYTQPIQVMMQRKDRDRERVLRKHGISYSLTSKLCSLM